MSSNLIRFDWAMKRLLRDKSNYVVLEGFLSTLLGEDLKICKFLESEGNQTDAHDKFNRVDLLAEDTKGELLIIEVQNNRELDYFHRMLYGVSKAITEYIGLGDEYSNVRKVYSVNIVYFDLGQGKDYVYHGKTVFQGMHEPEDILQLSIHQREMFVGKEAGDVFPEYYVLRVNEFDKVATTPLDEWIAYLKDGTIRPDTTAPGLKEAREKLKYYSMSPQERLIYDRHLDAIMIQNDVIDTAKWEGRIEGIAEGEAKGKAEGLAEGMRQVASKMKNTGVDIATIVKCTGLSEEIILSL